MSLKVLHLVFEATHVQDRSEFTLLLALADEADDDGRCFPGRKRLARKSRLSIRSTNDVTQRLIDREALEVIERGGPSEYGRPNLYLLDLDWLRNGPTEESEDGAENAPEEGVDNSAHPAIIAGCDPAAAARVQPSHPADDYQDPATVARKVQSSAPNPCNAAATSKSSIEHTAAYASDGVRSRAQKLLEDRGVDRAMAAKLAAEFTPRVIPLVQRFDAERGAGNPLGPGWLVTAIKEGWSTQAAGADKLLTFQEACDHNDRYGGPTGRPWDELLERVDTADGKRWRVR